MMKIRLLVPVLVLTLASLACQAVSFSARPVLPTATPAAAASVSPAVPPAKAPAQTAAPETAPSPGDQPGPAALDLEQLSADLAFSDFVQGYRVESAWVGPDGAGQSGSTTYLYRQQSFPNLRWILLYADRTPPSVSLFENAIIGPFGFSATPDTGCQIVSPEKLRSQEPRRAFVDLFEALTGTVKKSGVEVMLDDEPADLYTLEASNFKPGAEILLRSAPADAHGRFSAGAPNRLALIEQGARLESASLYLSRQGGYVAKVKLVYTRIAGETEARFAKPGTPITRTIIYDAAPTPSNGDLLTPPDACNDLTPQGEKSLG